MNKEIGSELAAAHPVAEFEIDGTRFTANRGEDVPKLTAILIAECRRRNESNPNLVRLNRDTWELKNA